MRLSARGISYAYTPGRPVVSDLSLEVEEREVLFILGPNGSGKTTLLECLGGLRQPQAGEVLLDGRDLYSLPPRLRAKLLGYVPQVHRPVFGYRVWEVVLMGRAPHLGPLSTPGRGDLRRVAWALEAVGLSGLAERPYTRLSGGELRLALIARGLAQGVKFLLLDEPDAHLDPSHQHRVLQLVRELADQGLAPLVTSHHPNNALHYGRRVILLGEGGLLASGPPEVVLTPGWLGELYGMEFELLVGKGGRRALIPAQGSSFTERDRGVGSASSASRAAKASAAAKGA